MQVKKNEIPADPSEGSYTISGLDTHAVQRLRAYDTSSAAGDAVRKFYHWTSAGAGATCVFVPAPTPPPTYDLVGLTKDEAQYLRRLVGESNSGPLHAGIYSALIGAGI